MTTSNSYNTFENEYVIFEYWEESGIIYTLYKEGVYIDLEAAKKIVSDRLAFQKEYSYPVFVEAEGTGVSNMTKEARDYLAKEGAEKITATGICEGSPVNNMITNFFLKISRPKIPTYFFQEKDKAIEWLKKYKSYS